MQPVDDQLATNQQLYPISLGFFKRQMEPLMQANTPKTEAFVRFDKNYMGMLNGNDSSDLS
jgi:hypothetical protein